MARPANLLAAGVTAATLTRMVNDGEVVRLSRGLHQFANAELDAQHSRVGRTVPRRVICLTSALANQPAPPDVWIAIGAWDWAPDWSGNQPT